MMMMMMCVCVLPKCDGVKGEHVSYVSCIAVHLAINHVNDLVLQVCACFMLPLPDFLQY